jgi:hypothetical protein
MNDWLCAHIACGSGMVIINFPDNEKMISWRLEDVGKKEK